MMSNNIAIPNDGHKSAHPIVFLFLVLPFGIVSGYATITLGYLLSTNGVSVEAIATLAGASLIPSVIKFLWAPLVDTTFSLKKWYIASAIMSAAGLLAIGLIPAKESSLSVLFLVIFLANIAVSFLGIVTNALAAYDTPEELKGRVGGYSQAGNLGGGGLGGGIGLLLALHYSNFIATAILGAACLLCCFGLFFIKEPVSTLKAEKPLKTIENLFKDLWITGKSRLGFLAIFLCFLPLGTGAASNLWSAVATDWHASADTVAFATGIFGGIITAVGCLIGGWLCDRMNRQVSYLVFGLVQAVAAVSMAYSPHTEIMYIFWTSFYAFSLGFCYASFSAFVFEAIGKGAAATKFTVYACLSNAPIYYMTLIDGWAHAHYGPTGMLSVEAIMGVIGVILFFGLMKYVHSRPLTVAVEK